MKQTATEWLFEKLWDSPKDKLIWNALLEQAKEMEKQQIKDANISGMQFIAVAPKYYDNDAEEYYTQTYEK